MRPTREQWAMNLAVETSRRSTCLRRQVGCVLLNSKGYVLATGYNGVASGLPHCNDSVTNLGCEMPNEVGASISYPAACSGARAQSGTDLDGCHAIHAEQNALLQCSNVHDITECYTTSSPCLTCTKLLLNTSCKVIYYRELYTHPTAIKLWKSSGRDIIQLA